MEETQEQTITMSIPVETEQSTSTPQEPVQPQTEAKPQEISTEPKPKHPGGRPCEFCQRETEIMSQVKKYISDSKIGKQIPYLEEIAYDLDVLDTTLVNWADKKREDGTLEHPQFLAAYKKLKMLQKLQLLKRTNGRFNPTGAIFQLKVNHGFIETEKRILAGDKTEPLQIEFINEKQLPTND